MPSSKKTKSLKELHKESWHDIKDHKAKFPESLERLSSASTRLSKKRIILPGSTACQKRERHYRSSACSSKKNKRQNTPTDFWKDNLLIFSRKQPAKKVLQARISFSFWRHGWTTPFSASAFLLRAGAQDNWSPTSTFL